MEISIKNLGPLRDARLELGDITVLLGPPNSGKSYTLKSLYGKLAMLDETALDYIVRSIAEEMEAFEAWRHIDYFIKTIVLQVLTAIIVLQDYPTSIDSREKIIGRLKEKTGIEEIDIKIEGDELTITLQNSETIAVPNLASMLKEKFDFILHGLLPVTEETEIKIPKMPIFEFSSLLLKTFETPSERETVTADKRGGISSHLKVSQRLEGKSVKLSITVQMHIKIGGSVWKRLKKDTEGLLATAKTKKEDEAVDIVVKGIFDHKPFPDLELWLLLTSLYSFVKESFVRPLKEQLRNVYRGAFNAQPVLFIPFGRSPFVYQVNRVGKDQWEGLVEIYKDNLPFYSYIHHLEKGINRLGNGKFNKTLIRYFNPVLQGELIFEKLTQKLRYQKWNSVDVPIDQASALAGEVAGILLPILSVPSNSLLLIEEPEAQLHYSAQVLMALTLAGLSREFNHRIVLSTHSDILAITLAYLKELEYDEDKISELIGALLEAQGIKIEREKIIPLAKAVSGAKDLDIRFYYYEPRPDGTVEVLPTPTKDILREVPGITEVTDILASWALNL